MCWFERYELVSALLRVATATILRCVLSMPTAPLQVLFDTLLEESKIQISSPETFQTSARDSIALFLHHFGILNKESRRIASEDASFPAIIYYERLRLNMAFMPVRQNVHESTKIAFFWECLPRQLSLSLPSHSECIHRNKARDMSFLGLLMEHQRYMKKAESGWSQADFELHRRDFEESFGHIASIPDKVRLFLVVMTSIFNSVREAQPPTHFKQCWNKKCSRLFYCNSKYTIRQWFDPTKLNVELLDVPSCAPVSTVSSELSFKYWNLCKQLPWYEDPSKRFCTSSCCIQWKKRIDGIIPNDVDFEPDLTLPVGKLSRINLALEKALERNMKFKTSLESNLARLRSGPVSKRLLRNELESRVEVLNIDTAMLYWATIVSRLPCYASDTTLPGFQDDWRLLDRNQIRCFYISTIHSHLHDDKPAQLITDVLSGGRLFSTIKSQCMSIDKRSKTLF
jgi:hypothetical protein